MAIKMINKQDWLVQVQRDGVRKSKRGTGGEAEARRAEQQLIDELAQERKLDEAARLLGVERGKDGTVAPPRIPTLREFFVERWVPHAKVVQNASTRRISQSPWNYLLHYLGDKTLVDLLRPAEINAYIETMKKTGSISFKLRLDGTRPQRRRTELTNATINQSLKMLRAALFLAHAEQVIPIEPRIDLLPTDDSRPVIPPTEAQFDRLLEVCEGFRHVAPLLPEVAVFTAETGLRRSELFNLTWRSVELDNDAIRVEMQPRGRVVNGVAWRPKHNKWRLVPLSKKAKEILVRLHAAGPSGADDLVFPSKGGAPYARIDATEEASGKGFFFDAVEAAGLKGKVTLHGLRHLFAVRLLTRGVPITIVSELLGHTDINLTVKRYGRFSSDAKVKWEAIRALDRAPEGPPPQEPTSTQTRKLFAIEGGKPKGKRG